MTPVRALICQLDLRYPVSAVADRRNKSSKASPVFEKINLDRLKHCEETANSAKRTIETSKRLTERARQLIETIHKDRPKAV